MLSEKEKVLYICTGNTHGDLTLKFTLLEKLIHIHSGGNNVHIVMVPVKLQVVLRVVMIVVLLQAVLLVVQCIKMIQWMTLLFLVSAKV